MIRLRSTKLLSGVSTLAVLASLGAVAPANAAIVFSGVNIWPVYTNTSVADQISVTTLSTLNSDAPLGTAPDLGNSIINQFNMSGAGDKILLNDGALAGGFLNQSGFTIASTNADAIDILNHAVIAGAINNSGVLSGGSNGVEINNSRVLRGMFNDIGASITGGVNGVAIIADSSYIGGISNEGNITGTAGDGIRMGGVNTDFLSGITNYAPGVITSNGAAAAAIDIGFGGPISSFEDAATSRTRDSRAPCGVSDTRPSVAPPSTRSTRRTRE